MTQPIKVRFAPSPTGYLHIGGLRSALFNYLIARKYNGKLLLRIEDTDQKREVEGAVDKLVEVLNWAGIHFDEGPVQGGENGPYIQSQRTDIYNQYAEELLNKGGAYRCFCSPERLEEMRKEQMANNQAPKYDRACRNLSEAETKERLDRGEPYVIRQKMPESGEITPRDYLRGEIRFSAEDLEDHVLIKSDGMPTYQFASVVDDHLMGVTHVTRGEEWLPSFPKNILLYQALGWEAPEFIHFPIILDKNGGKLSKRKGDVAVEQFRDKGYLPQALLNFNALLGWHPKDEKETLTLEEILERFEMEEIRTSPATFDVDKLDYLNGYHIRQLDIEELTDKCLPFLENNIQKASSSNKKQREFLRKVVALEQERLKKLSEIEELTEFLFIKQPQYDPQLLLWKKMTPEEVAENLRTILRLLQEIPEQEWGMKKIEEKIVGYIREQEEKVGNFLWPLRAALTGQEKSPGPFEVADALGKEESLKRVEEGIEKTSP